MFASSDVKQTKKQKPKFSGFTADTQALFHTGNKGGSHAHAPCTIVPLLYFFCSRDCCLCTMHQSVKELRHARSKGKQQTPRKPNKSNQKPQTNTHTNKKPQPSKFPLQLVKQVKQVKQVRREPHRVSNQFVQEELLRGNQTILTSEHGKTLSSRKLLWMMGRFRKTTRQTKPQSKNNNKNTTKQPNQKNTTKQTKTTEPTHHHGET